MEFLLQLMLQALHLDTTLVYLFVYDQCRMREHLLRYLQQKKMEPFKNAENRHSTCSVCKCIYTAIADTQTAGMQLCVVMVIHVESGSTLNTLTLL